MNLTPRQASVLAALAIIPMIILGPLAAFGVLPDGPAGLAMTVVAVLDVVVALALWRVLGPGAASTLAAVLRIVYAGVLLVAAARLSAGDRAALENIWDAGLLVFGLHLLLVGMILLVRRGVFVRVTGALLGAAGVGYTIDAVGALLGVALEVAQLTFVGELLLIVWLLVRGGRPVAVPAAPRPAIA